MTEFEDEVLKLLKEILALLKINKRPNNAVLVPCDKLAEMQAEIKAWKLHNEKLQWALAQQTNLLGGIEINNKPVSWWTGKFEDEGEDFMFPDTRQSHIDHPQSETHTFFPIPLYTHSVKELTEKEKWDVIDNCFGIDAFNFDYQITLGEARANAFELVKAILRKAQK